MSTQDIANDLVALCKEGKFDEAGEKYWAADVASYEAMPGDSDRDGEVDLADFASLPDCLTGPASSTIDAPSTT